MGRTFEILKLAEATHFSCGEGQAVLDLTDPLEGARSELAEAVPYIEVGGHGTAIEGSPDVLSGFTPGGEPRSLATAARTDLPSHRIPHPQTSERRDIHPASVAFRPLDSLRSLPLFPPSAGEEGHGWGARVAPEIIVFHQPDHPVSKEYQTLAEAIEAQLPMGGSQVLMFMGAGSGVGTTTVVLNLAFTWVRPETKRIVLVDAQAALPGAHHGSLAKKLGLSAPSLPPPSAAPWSEAPKAGGLQETNQANLFVLCSPIHPRQSGKALSAQGMRDILRQLRKQFDLVLIDAPPPTFPTPTSRGGHEWGELAALASGCDGVYLVVPQSDLKTSPTDELITEIQRQGLRLGGCVLTHKRGG